MFLENNYARSSLYLLIPKSTITTTKRMITIAARARMAVAQTGVPSCVTLVELRFVDISATAPDGQEIFFAEES